MNQVQTFNLGLVDLRVIELDDKPWFFAADVAHALGITNTSMAVARLPDEDKSQFDLGLRGKVPLIINESGLYSLIMRSDKPQAKAFQDWVTRVVLPAIRKDGAYVMGEEKVATGELSEDELVMRAMSIMSRKVERLSQERDQLALDKQALALTNDHLQHANQAMQPAAAIGQAVGALRSTTVMDFARKLDGVDLQQIQKSLGTMNYLYRRNGTWAV